MGGKGRGRRQGDDRPRAIRKFDTTFDITAKDAGRVLQMAGMGAQPPGKFGALALKGRAAGGGRCRTMSPCPWSASASMGRQRAELRVALWWNPADQLDLRHQG